MIGTNVTNIGDRAFYGCSSLSAITVDALNSFYCSVDGVLFNKSTNTLIQYPGGKAGTYTIPNSVTNIGSWAFAYCTKLTGIYFKGNAPSLGSSVFYGDSAIVYYLPRTTGWAATFGGLPTVLWNPQAQTSGPSFGVRTNRFGFNIIGSSNLVIVVEACTLTNLTWVPVGTNTLNTFIGTNGTSYFSDPKWTNYSLRCYRLRSP
jgi:hypothetical protein